MKKLLAISLFWICGLGLLAAQDATFKVVKGKVEYQLQGKDWQPANVGDVIPAGTMVSTGFKSTASLSSMGSLITLKPLTRMSIDDLEKSDTGTKTSLTLLSGKVKAEVRPKTASNDQQFEVKGPNATASVRGTGIDTDGVSILVNHGSVDFTNDYGISRSVQGGEFTTADGPGVAPPIVVKAADKPALNDDGTVNEDQVIEQDTSAEQTGTTVDVDTMTQSFGDQVSSGGSTQPSVQDTVNDVVSTVINDNLNVPTADLTVSIN